jgi:V/A-type H+-transporting ATPase subunit G/H
VAVESIRQVVDAEAEAEKIRLEGQAESKRIIAAAHERAQAIMQDAEEEALKEAGKITAQAEAEGQAQAEVIARNAQADGAAFKQKAAVNMDKAVAIIVERIVKT